MVPADDALSVFLAMHRSGLPAARRSKRFNAGEHVWLGSTGAKAACAELRATRRIDVPESLFSEIPRLNGHDVLDYGELVALSGDFYESPEALFEQRPTSLPWLLGGKDLDALREIFQVELTWIEDRHRSERAAYPDTNIRLAWNAKSYVELALDNVDHFGWHNIQAYRIHHTAAIKLALESRGRDDEKWRRARHVNAFADHFLTDGFAAGHIRIPRREIIDWAVEEGLGKRIAGSLSKLLHDQDGHIDTIHGFNEGQRDDGLLVLDSTGTSWRTRCDGQLFLQPDAESSIAVGRAVKAVHSSVLELLIAWTDGKAPSGLYEATTYVPFAHPDGPSLSSKFGSVSDDTCERLWESVAWYSKIPWVVGLERHHLRRLFDALPTIMQRFRGSVAATAAADTDIRERIAPAYVDAFCGVS